MNGWGPAEISSYTPNWPYWSQGWGSQNYSDTYNPAHYLTPADVINLRNPRNFTVFRSTYVPEPNPYTDNRWLAMNRTREEIGREGQDLGFGGWQWLGTRGG